MSVYSLISISALISFLGVVLLGLPLYRMIVFDSGKHIVEKVLYLLAVLAYGVSAQCGRENFYETARSATLIPVDMYGAFVLLAHWGFLLLTAGIVYFLLTRNEKSIPAVK